MNGLALQVARVSLPFLLLALGAACGQAPAGENPSAEGPAVEEVAATVDPIERGEYLVSILDCDVCHTPKLMGEQGPVPDMSRRLSGHPADETLEQPAMAPGWMSATNAHMTAWAGPWGISYASNLTPHETTGIAVWTDEMFVEAIREGRHMGTSRPILPPMPWQAYRNLPDEDLEAILAFLKSLPPVENQVPQPTPPATP